MIKINNQKGSITLFVLVSCMFFIASVVCIQMYIQSKKIAVDREYRQIKANYESTIKTDNIQNISFFEVGGVTSIDDSVLKGTVEVDENEVLKGRVDISEISKETDNSIKYKIIKSQSEVNVDNVNDSSIMTISEEHFIDKNTDELIFSINENNNNNNYYYLYIMKDDLIYLVTISQPLEE